MPSQCLLLAYDIEVAPDISNSTGFYLNGTSASHNGSVTASSLPLGNVVGIFSRDPYQAATFALHALVFVTATMLAGYSFRRTPPSQHRVFFRLRVALAFYILSRFFASVCTLVPNLSPLPRSYLIFGIVPEFFESAADLTLSWTLIRTACQPMVIASGFARAKSVAVGLTAAYGIFLAIGWFLFCVETYDILQVSTLQLVDISHPPPLSGRQVFGFVGGTLSIGLGIVAVLLALRGHQKAASLAAVYRRVAVYSIVASLMWIVRSALSVLVSVKVSTGVGASSLPGVIPFSGAVVSDILGMALFGVLFLAHRSGSATLFSPEGSYTQLNDYEGKTEGDLRHTINRDRVGMELQDTVNPVEERFEAETRDMN